MLKKYSLNSIFIFMLLATLPSYAVTILHPGVKINSKKLSAKMYMLNETEMASFTAWKINNDYLKRELIRKETTIKLYKDFNKELMKKFTSVSAAMLQTSNKLIQQVDGREKDRLRGRRAARKAGFFGLLRGLFYGGGITAIVNAVK